MKKQLQLTLQTKQNLTDAFWTLYCTKRIEKISIKEITTRAGYNRGTFYEYFKDVYDVLEQIENNLLARLQHLMIPPTLTPVPPMDISIPVGILFQLFEELGDYFIVLLGDQGDPAFLSKVKASFKPLLQAKLMAEGITPGYELDYTIEFTLNAMIGILNYWFSQQARPTLDQLFVLMNELMNEGVLKKIILLKSNAQTM
ncbi:TetR/AcrR family transcriptional regulator [Paenibacillus lignilyticus]|uniref:TetR/AcrR family transcriptional regulator n=1 Tax=Paenibacillus lignilyticus TaxID=1172615 RepID=A0ABS5CGR4_9BACL|nr:TetR/AcrR family transcriptional regulator [Paenibacillus lignilyticus]MBP3965082.1 TetR/AcrR family transcriptional regulator [Paenibacillus lignilyticus]